MHFADHAHAELGLRIVDRMTANDGDSGLATHFAAAAQDLLEDALSEQLARKANEIESEQRTRAHRVNVGERVCCSDAAEVVRIVDNGRKKVGRLHQRLVASNAVNARIVTRSGANQKITVFADRHLVENLR